jgi:hypothetical protein
MSTILAIICIVIGFIVGFSDGKDLLFNSLTWFVLAIAFEWLALPAFGPFERKPPAQ